MTRPSRKRPLSPSRRTRIVDNKQDTRDPDDSHSLLLIDDLVDAIEHCWSRRPKGGFGQYSHTELKKRLGDVLLLLPEDRQHDVGRQGALLLEWLIGPLIQIILEGGQGVNTVKLGPPQSTSRDQDILDEDESVMTDTSSQRSSLLHWMCQWKYLRHVYGWKGSDDMVLLVLRMGAIPTTVESQISCDDHDDNSSRESTLVAAVQYGSVATIQHLIHARKKKFNDVQDWIYQDLCLQDVWTKILNRACPDMLRLFLRYIPATERVWITSSGLEEQMTENEPVHVSALDYLLHNLLQWCDESIDNGTASCDMSLSSSRPRHDYWEIVGMPSVQQYSQCLVQLLQQNGVTYTPLTMKLLSRMIKCRHLFKVHNVATQPQQYAYMVAQGLFGNNWMPPSLSFKLSARDTKNLPQLSSAQDTSNPNLCPICLEEYPPKGSDQNKIVTLYCGHGFCVNCILSWGAAEPERLRCTRALEVSCPICREPLARDLLNDTNRDSLASLGYRRRNTLGMHSHLGTESRGPQHASRSQTIMECQARGLLPSSTDEKDLKGFDAAAQSLKAQWRAVRQQRRDGPKIMVDVAASFTLSPHYVAPKQGPVVIPIHIVDKDDGGIPILAGLSGFASYTVVTPSLVKLLGLRTTKLKSDQFRELRCRTRIASNGNDSDESDSDDSDSDGEEPPVAVRKYPVTMALVDELVVTLGTSPSSKIKVRLRNAVVEATGTSMTTEAWRPGIVLGLDFLESAAWTQTCVEVDVAPSIRMTRDDDSQLSDRRFMVILHGGQDIQRVSEDDSMKMIEEFRYYASNGRSFRTPLLHIQPTNRFFFSVQHENTTTINSRPNQRRQRYTECEWCCRMFPNLKSHNEARHPRRLLLSRADRSPQRGMIQCNLCSDKNMSTGRYPVYYCDEFCKAQAHKVHCYRHTKHCGILVSSCRTVLSSLMEAARQQKRIFWVSYFIGFLISIGMTMVRGAPLPIMDMPPLFMAWVRDCLAKSTYMHLYK